MATLRTDYKDDIFTGNRKYNQIENPDNSISFQDVTDYAQQGDTYGAAEINETNEAINSLSSSVDTLEDEFTANGNRLYMDYKNGKYGYNTSANRGADTFHPFKRELELVGTYSANTTVNVSSYGASSASEFLLVPYTGASGSGSGGADTPPGTSWSINCSYSPGGLSLANNVLTVTVPSLSAASYLLKSSEGYANMVSCGANIPCRVYYIG